MTTEGRPYNQIQLKFDFLSNLLGHDTNTDLC